MSMLDIELEVKRVRGEILACRTGNLTQPIFGNFLTPITFVFPLCSSEFVRLKAEELLQKHNELRAYYAVKYSSLIRARKASIAKQNKDMVTIPASSHVRSTLSISPCVFDLYFQFNQLIEFFAGTDTAPPASPSTTPVQPAREVFIHAEAAQRKGAEGTTLVRRRRVVT
jgi:hypothetical protein